MNSDHSFTLAHNVSTIAKAVDEANWNLNSIHWRWRPDFSYRWKNNLLDGGEDTSRQILSEMDPSVWQNSDLLHNAQPPLSEESDAFLTTIQPFAAGGWDEVDVIANQEAFLAYFTPDGDINKCNADEDGTLSKSIGSRRVPCFPASQVYKH